MASNYGAGSRDMADAGRMILSKRSCNGFKTKSDLADRWRIFAIWSENHGIKKMENVTPDLVIRYGQYQQELIQSNERTASTAKNYVSAVNTVMRLATAGKWKPVAPGKDCGIQKRKYIPEKSKALSEERHIVIQDKISERLASMMELQRTIGLRFKESALINPLKALKEANTKGYITIIAGTKGGRHRRVTINPEAILALEKAVLQQENQSMVPRDMSYIEFKKKCYAEISTHGTGFHAERHYFAQNRYYQITGAPAPINQGWGRKNRIKHLSDYLNVSEETAAEIDRKARLIVSKELGHGRVEVSNAYLG